MIRIPLIAGNWKMYKTNAEAKEFADVFGKLYKEAGTDIEACICCPYTDLKTAVDAFKGTGVKVGAENVHFEDEGAFTGEISAKMLEEIGVDYCIVGHSERRQYFGETDETVAKKLRVLLGSTKIVPILCVGESLETRESGKAESFVRAQVDAATEGLTDAELKRLVIAYEPIWAIGTGKTATKEEAGSMCAEIREELIDLFGEEIADEIRILYGGSVKPANITEIMMQPEIDGALVGGASLKAADFMDIVNF